MMKLGNISNAAKSIQVDGFSAKAFQEIASAVRAIATLISRHNTTEETLLFPMLERHVNDMPGSILLEHREVNRAFNELLRSINDIEDGRIHGSSIRELLQLANFVVNHLGNHMTKENTVLFPMAKRLLTNEEYEKLRVGVALSATQA
jgi:hemerythrin-like domain-containing protein